MQDLESLSRDELITYIKFLSGLTMAVDGLWFMAAEKATDFDQALDMDIDVWSGYAAVVVKRIRKNFDIKGSGMAALKEILRHDPLWWGMDIEITEDSPDRLVFEVLKCPSLTAMEKMNREKLTCEPVERAYLEALAKAVAPNIQVEALKLPPRQSPSEICCRWAFSEVSKP